MPTPSPPSLATADPHQRSGVDKLFFDVDDTLTWRGQLPEAAAVALYKAHAAGLSLFAVTGRSFAWAEMLMRFFPLDAAIAETGACALVRVDTRRGVSSTESGSVRIDGRVDVVHTEPDAKVRRELARERERISDLVLREHDEARLALDNPGRLYDSAFDLVESGPPVSTTGAREIRAILEREGLTTAQSSVHINAWKIGPHGGFDKASMVDRVLQENFDSSLAEAAPTMCYVGDSENDGSLWARVTKHGGISVGVGNVRPHLLALEAKKQAPTYIVDASGGRGFAQVVASLVEDR